MTPDMLDAAGSPSHVDGSFRSNSQRVAHGRGSVAQSGSSRGRKYGGFFATSVPGRLVTTVGTPSSMSDCATRDPTHPAPKISTGSSLSNPLSASSPAMH